MRSKSLILSCAVALGAVLLPAAVRAQHIVPTTRCVYTSVGHTCYPSYDDYDRAERNRERDRDRAFERADRAREQAEARAEARTNATIRLREANLRRQTLLDFSREAERMRARDRADVNRERAERTRERNHEIAERNRDRAALNRETREWERARMRTRMYW
jgi:hypothetical protein